MDKAHLLAGAVDVPHGRIFGTQGGGDGGTQGGGMVGDKGKKAIHYKISTLEVPAPLQCLAFTLHIVQSIQSLGGENIWFKLPFGLVYTVMIESA